MTEAECRIAAERRTVTVDGVRLSLLEWAGTGPAAVLLHGVTSSAATYWQLGRDLAAAGRRVIAFDLPGHGESDAVELHGIADLAGLLLRAWRGLGLAQITLIGHSWGGALALSTAVQAPEGLIAQLVLIDPLLGLDAAKAPQSMAGYAADIGTAAVALLPRLALERPDWAPCDVYWKAIAFEQCRPAQVHGLFHPPVSWQMVDQLTALTLPTLVLLADPAHTILWPDAAKQLNRQMLHSETLQVATVTGATHNIQRGPSYGALWRELVDFGAAGDAVA
jgi:pimeloyl-ACP methyl ester carboxylesterase